MKRRPAQTRRVVSFQGFFQSRLTLVIGLALIAVIGTGLFREISNRQSLSHERQQLEDQVSALEGRNTELSALIDRLQSSDYAEEEARLKLGLKKPGEKVIRIIGRSSDATSTAADVQADTTPQSVPVQWWNYFFNH